MKRPDLDDLASEFRKAQRRMDYAFSKAVLKEWSEVFMTRHPEFFWDPKTSPRWPSSLSSICVKGYWLSQGYGKLFPKTGRGWDFVTRVLTEFLFGVPLETPLTCLAVASDFLYVMNTSECAPGSRFPAPPGEAYVSRFLEGYVQDRGGHSAAQTDVDAYLWGFTEEQMRQVEDHARQD
jgi:hypothetical protein